MEFKQYQKQRTQLLNEARTLINDGQLEAAEAKKTEVETLDAKYEQAAKAQAGLNALENTAVVPAMENLSHSIPNDAAVQVIGQMDNSAKPAGGDALKFDNAHPGYENAWAKTMLNQPMTADEKTVFSLVNEYLHTTENTGAVIPKSTVIGILDMAAELYPLYADAAKTFIKGNITLVVEDTATDANWYDEATKTEDEEIHLREVDLVGCELAKQVRISWKLRSMAVQEFLTYIIRESASKMGKGLGYGASHGKGKPGSGDTFKAEPLGVITALKAEASTPHVTKYPAGSLTYKQLTAARAKVKSRFSAGLKVYANAATLWGELANVMDDMGRPMLIGNVAQESGVARLLGLAVEEDDSLQNGEILFANMQQGYAFNINRDVTVEPFEKPEDRQTLYVAYAIVDGTPKYLDAFSLLTNAPTP